MRVYTDPIEYSTEEMQQLLIMMDEGNKTRVSKKDSSGAYQGLRTVLKAFGLVGFIKFTQGYYMILITQRRKVGQIGSNHIFEVYDYECRVDMMRFGKQRLFHYRKSIRVLHSK